jgi:serpin B
MGMVDAFDERKADVSGLNGEWDFYVSAVRHKAFLEVNEEGSESAAASAVVIAMRGAPVSEPPAVFRADHPFLLLIRENQTGALPFPGRMLNPSA